jgi:uncharacterized membrane protein YgcG
MKTSVLKKGMALSLILLCLAVCLTLPLSAAETDRVYDPADMLNDTETAKLTALLDQLSRENGVELYLATYHAKSYGDKYIGDDYCDTVRDLNGKDAVLLVVTYDPLDPFESYDYFYNLYTYGKADYAISPKISQKEVNYILDDSDVYANLKNGYIYDGCEAFFTLSVQAYTGRVGMAWSVIIFLSAAISVGIAFAVRGAVIAVYRKKKATVDYPLDRYAKLELTHESDSYVTEHTTRTYSPRSSGSGGGSRHGGGGGHRGGR